MSPSASPRQPGCPEPACAGPGCPGPACPGHPSGHAPQRTRVYDRLHALYKSFLSPMLHAAGFAPGGCRFQPTCSEYAALALAQHGLARGLSMTLTRLLRCHPFARGGWDPVPFKDAGPPEAPPKGTIEAAQSVHKGSTARR